MTDPEYHRLLFLGTMGKKESKPQTKAAYGSRTYLHCTRKEEEFLPLVGAAATNEGVSRLVSRRTKDTTIVLVWHHGVGV